ncbi:MAG: DUF3137 domain-containing protein [Pseudomonadota bacterium]
MSTPTSDDGIDPSIKAALDGLPDDFRDFGRVFQTEIQPALRDREHQRVSAADTARKSTWAAVAIGVIGAIVGFGVFKAPPVGVIAIVVAIGTAALGRAPLSRIGKEAKGLIVQPIAARLDLMFDPSPGRQSGLQDFRAVRLVSSWDRANFEDRLVGTRNGVDFDFFEAHLEDKRTTRDSNGNTRTRWVTVFRGQCIRFKFHKRFYGKTLITRDAGLFNRFGGGKGMQRASLEDPTFEKAFEVYTTDQVEARFLLTPDLMQSLNDLETAFHGADLKCAFAGGEMLVTVEGGDLFEPGSMFTPLDDPKRVRDLLDDFSAVFNVIDSVMKGRRAEEDQRPEPPPTDDGDSPWTEFLER